MRPSRLKTCGVFTSWLSQAHTGLFPLTPSGQNSSYACPTVRLVCRKHSRLKTFDPSRPRLSPPVYLCIAHWFWLLCDAQCPSTPLKDLPKQAFPLSPFWHAASGVLVQLLDAAALYVTPSVQLLCTLPVPSSPNFGCLTLAGSSLFMLYCGTVMYSQERNVIALMEC